MLILHHSQDFLEEYEGPMWREGDAMRERGGLTLAFDAAAHHLVLTPLI
jgi:hypothetical protein